MITTVEDTWTSICTTFQMSGYPNPQYTRLYGLGQYLTYSPPQLTPFHPAHTLQFYIQLTLYMGNIPSLSTGTAKAEF